MPTLPTHDRRDAAESFGAVAERYDRTRPAYPTALVARIVAASPGPDVLDVGCGTGISSRQLAAAGCRVLGVDVDPKMAEVARATGIEVEVAKFEDWEPAGRRFDAVVAGQTWHWVDPVAGAAKASSVLRPGGRLALLWNVAQTPPDLTAAFAEVYRRVLPQFAAYDPEKPALSLYELMFTAAEDGVREAGGFAVPERWAEDWSRQYTRDEWLDQVPTFGGHSRLAPEQQEALLTGIGEAVDAAGGAFTMQYATVAVTTTRA